MNIRSPQRLILGIYGAFICFLLPPVVGLIASIALVFANELID